MFVTRNYKLSNVLIYTVIGTIAGTVIGYLLHYIDKIDITGPTFRGLFIGFLVGTTIGLCEEFLFLERFRKKSYFFLLLFRTIVYSAVIAFHELLINSASNFLTLGLSVSQSIYTAVYRENFPRDLSIIAVVSVVSITFLQIRRLHRPGDLTKYVTGRYHLPEEVDKIILFIDLKSSTAIAERLGNTKYSSFLIDYFHDMTGAILMSKAEIYQYIGDEIILTWSFKEGIKHARCINCFFDILTAIEWNREQYLNKYGTETDEDFEIYCGLIQQGWKILPISALNGRNFDHLRYLVFESLHIIRVYTRAPGREPEFSHPFVLKKGSTIEELAARIHKDFVINLKTIRVWGKSVFDGQLVQRGYILSDGDIVELNV